MPKDACPDCGKPKDKRAKRCRKCAGKAGFPRKLAPAAQAEEELLAQIYIPNCGTYAGYKKHLRYGITPCAPCRKAGREYTYASRERRNARLLATQ